MSWPLNFWSWSSVTQGMSAPPSLAPLGPRWAVGRLRRSGRPPRTWTPCKNCSYQKALQRPSSWWKASIPLFFPLQAPQLVARITPEGKIGSKRRCVLRNLRYWSLITWGFKVFEGGQERPQQGSVELSAIRKANWIEWFGAHCRKRSLNHANEEKFDTDKDSGLVPEISP